MLKAESSLINAIYIHDMGFSDHFLVIATVNLQMPQIICSTSFQRHFRNLDEDLFRGHKRSILVHGAFMKINPKSNTNNFANQLTYDLVKVLDELIPLKKSTRRRGKQTLLLSAEAIVWRRARRRFEWQYRPMKSEADWLWAYRPACRVTNVVFRRRYRPTVRTVCRTVRGCVRCP